MAHYAFIDKNNVVTEVINGRNETVTENGVFWENFYGNLRGQKCLRTSYHGNIRKQYAGIGYTYDENADVFISPQPYPSWTLDSNYDWQPPVPYPNDGGYYIWNEQLNEWVLVS